MRGLRRGKQKREPFQRIRACRLKLSCLREQLLGDLGVGAGGKRGIRRVGGEERGEA